MPKQINLPPLPVLEASAYDTTDGIVTFDATKSTDPNRGGIVKRVKFWGDNDIVFTSPAELTTPYPYTTITDYKATAQLKEGITTVSLQCWDKAGNASAIVSIQVLMWAKHVMLVGVKLQQAPIQEQLGTAKAMACTLSRPNSVCVTGNRALDDGNAAEWVAEGFDAWVNVAWYENPTAKPYHFLQPIDRPKWAAGLEILCQKLQAAGVTGIAVENEEANAVYYQFPETWLENYIEQLKIAIPIARKYGLKISDGSVPIEDVELIMNGQAKRERTKRVQALLNAFKGLDLDYVLFHAHYNAADNRNPVKDLPATIKYLEDVTGHRAFSNELSMEGATAAVITWFLQGCFDAKCDYTMFWSGDGGAGNSKGDEIVATNDLGKAIVSWQNQH